MRPFYRFLAVATLTIASVAVLAPLLAPLLAQTVAIPPQAGPTPSIVGSRRALVDINTATPEELKSLPGIGDEYVRRIIAGRPYTAKNQLVTRGVLPQGAYTRIAGSIVARRPRR